MASHSLKRLSSLIKQRTATILQRELKDPRLGFVTITKVELAADLVTCKVFYSVMGSEADRSKTRHALEHARGWLQKRVGEGLRTRNVPQLSFHFDESIEGAVRLGELLQGLRESRAAEEERSAPDPDEDGDGV